MTERRATPRHAALPGRLFHVLAPDGTTLAHGVLEDASAGGVRILVARPCPLGPAVLEPMPPHPLAGRQFPFRAVRSGPVGGGGAHVAGPFDPPISDAEARALAEAP
jgi:hypothetical protein